MKTILSRKHLAAALHFAGKQDIRYYLNGLLIEVAPTETRVAATDGNCAAVLRTLQINDERFEITVPRATVELALKMKIEKMDLIRDTNNYWSLSGIRFEPVDGKFPDYRRIIPGHCSGKAAHGFNPEFFGRCAKVGKDLGYGQLHPTIRQNGDDAALAHFYAKDEFIGVLMPLRGYTEKMPDLGAPTWGKERA